MQEPEKLTDAVIAKIVARISKGGGEVLRKDGGTPNLYLRVRPSSATFVLRPKRFDTGKGKRKTNVITLGDWPEYGLALARAEAHARAVHSAGAPRLTVGEALERHRQAHEDEGKPEKRWREQGADE